MQQVIRATETSRSPSLSDTVLCLNEGEVGKMFKGGGGGGGQAFLRTNENKAHSASLLVIRPID